MKSKILFGALLGSIALASCTADENLKSSSVSQESPIKFAVSLETGNGITSLTRAELTDMMKLNFQTGDLMSLFHGTEDASESFTGYQNAIYEGTAKDGEVLVFTTKSMVLSGDAIMVYPADTTFTNNGGSAPNITISTEQDEKTKELMPYMSEILDIADYEPGEVENIAGYGKKYDIVLKQVASTLSLTIVPSNTDEIDKLDVSPLKVSKVELNAADAFTESIAINATGSVPKKKEDYPLWSGVSDVDLTTATKVGALSTTDITNNYNVVFTLLPSADNISVEEATIVIYTNYGKVTLDEDKGTIWGESAATGTYSETVSAGIQNVLQNTWIENTTGVIFNGEKTGGSFRRSIKADMAELDMDGLHITDQEYLLDALKVYDAIAGGADVTFYLDGDENGEFVMDAEAAAAYEAHVADDDNKITFTLSDDKATKCDAVKFVSTEETEVPKVLAFGNSTSVKFAGLWKYSKDDKEFENVESLEVIKTATMTMTNSVAAAGNATITNNGTVNISGATTLKLDMTNNGKINIPVGAELLMNNATLTNDATDLDEYGQIDNAGSLGVQSMTAGKINNYGYITQKNANAYTYVSTNADEEADFANAFSADNNKIGTIELFGTGTANTTISAAGEEGFIKVITNAATVTEDEVGKYANYVEITGACTACGDLPETVKYVEIKSSERVIWTTTEKFTLEGLIVDEGYSLNIPRGSEITSNTTYLKGRIYNAGTFTCDDFEGYLGGATDDASNVIVGGDTGE